MNGPVRDQSTDTVTFPAPGEGKLDAPRFDSAGDVSGDLLDRIDQITLPRVFNAARPSADAWELDWEELDPNARAVRRYRTAFPGTIRCRREGNGLFLEVEGARGGVWVSTMPYPEPPPGSWARVGWTAGAPRFAWRYLRDRHGAVQVEARWSFVGLPDDWVQALLERTPVLGCRSGALRVELHEEGRDGLAYAGRAPLPAGEPLDLVREFTVEPVVTLATVGAAAPSGAFWSEPAGVEVLDLRAELRGRQTRYVADADQDEPVSLLLAAPTDVMLPPEIAAGILPQFPFDLQVEEAQRPARGVAFWRLSPRERVPWREVPWGDGAPLAVAFGAAPVAERARVHRVPDRRIRLEWRVQPAQRGGGLLALASERWARPGGGESQVAPLNLARSGFAELVEAAEGDGERFEVREFFDVDSDSELPARRILLDPATGRATDAAGNEVRDAVVYGYLGGNVRWRRPPADDGEASAADWVAGSSEPLLVVAEGLKEPAWGALHASEPLRWRSLDELAAVEEEAGRVVVETDSESQQLWISLLGHLTRYDRHEIRMEGAGGEAPDTAWIARRPLPLFPQRSGALLRSFNPLFAVEDTGDRVAFEATEPRPTLRLGQALVRGGRPSMLRVAPGTRLRVTRVAAGQVPPAFPHGAVPGEPCRVPDPAPPTAAQGDEVWLALATGAGGSEPGGYLVSWRPGDRWTLRGFYAPAGHGVRLGTVPFGDPPLPVPVVLRDVPAGGAGSFTVTFASVPEWGENTPDEIRRAVPRAELETWRNRDFLDADLRPEPLRAFHQQTYQARDGRVMIRFSRAAGRIKRKLPIQVWRWIPGTDAPDVEGVQGATIGDERHPVHAAGAADLEASSGVAPVALFPDPAISAAGRGGGGLTVPQTAPRRTILADEAEAPGDAPPRPATSTGAAPRRVIGQEKAPDGAAPGGLRALPPPSKPRVITADGAVPGGEGSVAGSGAAAPAEPRAPGPPPRLPAPASETAGVPAASGGEPDTAPVPALPALHARPGAETGAETAPAPELPAAGPEVKP
jgi:hypothetical protein